MTSSKDKPLPIDRQYLIQTLEELLEIPSPTGFTDTIVRFVSAELGKLGLTVELTRRGAIRAVLPAPEERGARAIVSHLDTLGAQVRQLKANGRLSLAPIGHWSARFAEGARATIFSEAGPSRGTILPLKASGHAFNEEIDTQPVGWEHVELRIDDITSSFDETATLGIEVGDIVAIDPQPEFLENGFIVSRHLDDKAGVATTLAALKAIRQSDLQPPVEVHWLFTIAEEVGVGAASILTPEVASMLTIDNGTTAPGQSSREFGVTISMADQTGPFDYHLTKKLKHLCIENDIDYQKDVFRHYRSDSASALEAGADVRTALITFGVDASHGYERIHYDALESVARLICAFAASPVEIERDLEETSDISGFTRQPTQTPT
ncbi:osmoprotectant NAGGN system M42 family peptidase [Roseibium polysiphoniae]|uniref:Osmoprotectant NAGGN system M42 family peptidase n=1 Tax=Roseibium polysiphoniae TaxID=2571221 RepID=A0A944CCU1_9HYPH|nr:osmoprotectant NAGGN system M42 family peptidase [Roseibium polysiphoniae]